jgi:cysteine-rich CPCC protein
MNSPRVSCPCCGFLTLTERSAFEICPVCFWEDDGQDDADADDTKGGPNSSSLTEARRNFLERAKKQPWDPCGHRIPMRCPRRPKLGLSGARASAFAVI